MRGDNGRGRGWEEEEGRVIASLRPGCKFTEMRKTGGEASLHFINPKDGEVKSFIFYFLRWHPMIRPWHSVRLLCAGDFKGRKVACLVQILVRVGRLGSDFQPVPSSNGVLPQMKTSMTECLHYMLDCGLWENCSEKMTPCSFILLQNRCICNGIFI